MPAQKSKATTTTANGAPAKKAATPAASGTATPVSTDAKADLSAPTTAGGGRPDKAAYDAEQDKIKVEIDALQVKLTAVKDKISLATKGGPGNERRNALRAELDSIRGQQSTNKSSRGKVLDQIKALQDGIQRKIKDMQATRSKIPFKSVAEVDAHIRNLEKQVESGSMKLVDEKRALQEISQCKRNRRTVEGLQAEQDVIEADRQQVEELRKQLDDPEFKSVSDRYDAIKAELDEIKKESDDAYTGRSKLFEERDTLQAQVNELFNQKRESSQRYRDANDRYWNKVNEDRARRAERQRAERAAEEAKKKQEHAERLREEAEAPAFQSQIDDCQTLIDYFNGMIGGKSEAPKSATPLSAKADVAGVPKLELRQVDAPDGMVARKKKGEGEEESYFMGGKGKAKGKKGPKAGSPAPANGSATPGSQQLNLEMGKLAALLSLSIPPPTSLADVPRLVEDLKTKKAWFDANQARVTAENIAKAEADIQRLTIGTKTDSKAAISPSVTGPNGGGERPAEPAPTPAEADTLPTAVSTDEVDNKLVAVQEDEVAA